MPESTEAPRCARTAAMQMRVIRHGLVESTNELAFEALARGAGRHGDVHLATGQTRGRGRRGASWFSPEGRGLYLSLIWMPPPEQGETSGLSIAVGLGMHDALVGLGLAGCAGLPRAAEPDAALTLKWPNDLLAGSAKLCGILIESRGLAPRAPRFVIGIGLNVGPLEAPAELLAERPVTSLADLGLALEVEDVLEATLPALARRLAQLEEDPAGLTRDYLEAAGLTGQEVLVDGPQEVRGRVIGMDLVRGLELVQADGTALTLRLGHVRGLRRI